MTKTLTVLIGRDATHLAQDALGALSLCITFVAVLYLPGLF